MRLRDVRVFLKINEVDYVIATPIGNPFRLQYYKCDISIDW